jgi:hypothetical protein
MSLAGKVAKVFLARAEALDMKGKKRDANALEFVCGAAEAARAIMEETDKSQAPDAAKKLATLQFQGLEKCAFVVSVRGFSWLKEMAEKETV